MATRTTNYDLIKPEPTDEYGDFLQAFNDNMETIDENLGGGGGGGSSTLAGLNDVSLTTPITNDALIYDGAEWVNAPLSAVAFSGDYSDLQNAPAIPTKTSDLNNDSGFLTSSDVAPVAMSGDYSDLSNTPNLATVATSGDYSDLSNTPNLATVATSGDYSDLSNTPTIPSAVSDLTNDEGFTAVGWNQIQSSGTKIAEIEIDGVSQDVYAPTGGGGGGGHTIEDGSGTAMTARSNLQFEDLSVTDDSVNDATVVSASGKADKEDLTEIFETGLTASQRILDGSYFYLNDFLCYAITDINVGDTFTIFSNYRRLTGSGGFGSLNHVRNLFNEKVSKDGDTMTGELDVINRFSTTVIRADYNHSESVSKAALVRIGNDTPDGTEGSTYGRLLLYGKGANYAILSADDVTANRNCYMRDTGGTMALTKDISTVVQDGETATEAITFGKRFYRNGILCRAITNIASGETFTSSNYESTNLNVIGAYLNSSNVTTTVATATATNVRSITLTRGVWVITAGCGYSTSFTQAVYIRLKDGTTNLGGTQVRGTGASGGNLNTSIVYAVTTSSATIYLVAYQASGSDKTTESAMLKAVRIA